MQTTSHECHMFHRDESIWTFFVSRERAFYDFKMVTISLKTIHLQIIWLAFKLTGNFRIIAKFESTLLYATLNHYCVSFICRLNVGFNQIVCLFVFFFVFFLFLSLGVGIYFQLIIAHKSRTKWARGAGAKRAIPFEMISKKMYKSNLVKFQAKEPTFCDLLIGCMRKYINKSTFEIAWNMQNEICAKLKKRTNVIKKNQFWVFRSSLSLAGFFSFI